MGSQLIENGRRQRALTLSHIVSIARADLSLTQSGRKFSRPPSSIYLTTFLYIFVTFSRQKDAIYND